MARIQTQDRALFSATEWALIETSSPSEMRDLTAARLKAQMTRTKRYLDKYRDLTRRQQGATKKGSNTGAAKALSNVRTMRKAELLSKALTRFEKRLEQLERPEPKTAGERPKPSRMGSPASATQRETLRRRKQRREAATESASATRNTRQFQKSMMRSIQGHISASGKRRQGRRDARVMS